jgi:D-aspartate ligase
MSKAPAIVIGLNPNALGTIRALTAKGIKVIAIDAAPAGPNDTHKWMASRTWLCKKIFLEPRASADAIIWRLIESPADFPDGSVIIPSGDEPVLAMSAQRERLSKRFRFHLPSPELLQMFGDKVRTHAFAQQHAIPSPQTWFELPPAHLASQVPDNAFPCVIKPPYRDERWETTFRNTKAFVVHNAAELAERYADVYAKYSQLLVQEMVPGNDKELFFSHIYIGRDGRELALWTGHKVRQLPIHVGTSTAARTTWVPEVAEFTRRITRATDYRGYASVEFKRDPHDGSFKLIEVTLARTWYPHYLGVAAGMNIPYLWYSDLIGDRSEPVTRFNENKLWVDEYRDLVAGADYRSVGELTIAQWLGSLAHGFTPALTSVRDPLPSIFILLRLSLSAWRAVKRVAGLRT